MTAVVKGRVLDYSGAPIASTLIFVPATTPTGVSESVVLAKPVKVRANSRGEYSLRLAAGSYTVRLDPTGLSVEVALHDGEEYGLATLLGVTDGDSYSVTVSDDGVTMTIPATYLVGEDGEQYALGGVTAYTVAGTDAQIEDAIGSKVEDIAASKIEELVAAEVEESAGPLIEAKVTEEVDPLRTAVTGLESDLTSLEGTHADDVARLTNEDSALEVSIADVASTAEDARSAASGNTAALTALTERVAAVEAREDQDTVYDDTAITARVKAVEDDVAGLEEDSTYWEESLQALRQDVTALQNREDKDTIYDDSALSGRVDAVETDVDALEGRVTSLEDGGAGSGTSYDDTELRGRIEAVEGDVTTLETQMSTAVVAILKLGTDDAIPDGTPAGTLVVRVSE